MLFMNCNIIFSILSKVPSVKSEIQSPKFKVSFKQHLTELFLQDNSNLIHPKFPFFIPDRYRKLVSESFLMSYKTMCKKLNFVYMIDRMKYQYFDFSAISS